MRPEPRPADIAEAAAWDAFTIMYSPAGRRPHPDERKTVGRKFPELISKLRELAVKANTDLAAAEAQKAANVKDRKVEQRSREQALVKAIRVAIDSPHQDLRDTLFSFDKFVVIMANTLRMVVKSENYFGDLAIAVLELMSTYKFKGPSKEALEKAKFPQIAKRFKSRLENKAADPVVAKRQEDVARLIKAIEDSQLETKPEGKRVGAFAAPKLASKPDDNAAPRTDNIPLRAPVTATPRYEGTAGLKRAREPDSSTNIPNKRTTPTASETAKPAARGAVTLGPAKSTASTSFFSKLGKQTPKPATPPTAGAAAPKPVVKKPAPPQAPRTSVLGSLLDSINAPKPEPKKVESIKRAPETPEEKKKRERKESRRHLRVRFKEEGELEEIRLFTHEKAEDEGRDVDMLRDAHDDRSEGMMLKQRVDTESIDDEEDATMVDAQDIDINSQEWPHLSEIDFSDLSEVARKENIITRGGLVEFNTPQQTIQANREATELMVVYTDESDIPESAKEPSSVPAENKNPVRFGDVKDQNIKDRLRDIQFQGDEVAFSNMMSQLDAKLIWKAQLTQGPESIKFILDTIKQNPSVDVGNFYVPPGMDKGAMGNLYRVFASKQGLPFPAKQAPAWMSPQMQQSWYEAVAREEARKAAQEAEKNRLAAEEEARKVFEARQQLSFAPPMGAPPMGQPAMAQPPFMGVPPMNAPPMGGHYPGMPGPPPDPQQMAALLASMGFPDAKPPPVQHWGQPPAAFPPPQAQSYGNNNSNPNPYPGNYGQNDQQGGQTDQRGDQGYGNDAYGNNRRNNNFGEESSDTGHHGKKKKWGKKGRRNDPDDPQQFIGERQHGGSYKRKTIPCQFYQKGQCSKGDDCSFIHDLSYS